MLRLFCLTIYHTVSGKRKNIPKRWLVETQCAHYLPSCQCHFQTAKKSEYRCILYRKCIWLPDEPQRERDARWQKNEGRNREHRRRGQKGGGVNGNVAEAQWNYINLSKCIWSLAFDRNRDGRMWPREGNAAVKKCNTMMWLATDV